MLLFVFAIDDVSAFVEIDPLVTRYRERRVRLIVPFEKLLHIVASYHAGTLVLQEWCRIPFQNANVQIFAEMLQGDTHEEAA